MNNNNTAIIHTAPADRYELVLKFVNDRMKFGTDYGKVPNTSKLTLLKPGAEKLCHLFGLSTNFELIEAKQDFTGKEFGEPFFYYWYRCSLCYGEQLVAQSDGSCNSWEKKYRYRESKPVCPKCGEATIRKSEKEFYCWVKIGGCGARFALNYEAIASQKIGQVTNAEIFDQVNTLQKMAQKRALIGAVLLATSASEFFTQDVGDDSF
jgi:predicted RNA-binding Zn-ribbon protein involved in translation (DUF1610 family)